MKQAVRLALALAGLLIFIIGQAGSGRSAENAVSKLAESLYVDPLVIVVHGSGGGNREDGWSRPCADAWGVQTHEVTFRRKGRTPAGSLTDFARYAGDWALDAQSQIQNIVKANPGRRVIIVSHSWGTVVTKMALAGGVGAGNSDQLVQADNHIRPLDLGGVEIEEWVTLGSPLGRADLGTVGHVQVPDGLPGIVKHWTNFYDVADPVSKPSHNLTGADNVGVKGSGNSWDLTGTSAHTGIWTNPAVRKHIWNAALVVSNMAPLPATRVGNVTGPAIDRRPTGSDRNSDEQIVGEYRSLLPAVLEKNKKPWHTRINIVANAEKQGTGYHVNYQTYCLIEQGPDQGKDHMCFEYDTVLDLGGIKSAVADMKRQLGRSD